MIFLGPGRIERKAMDGIWNIMDLIFAGAGIYVLYAYVLLKTKGELVTSILLSKDVDIRKCKDIEGYKRFVMPKILVFGIITVFHGVLGLVNSYAFPVPGAVYGASMAVFFIVLIWYTVQTKKAIQLFW